MRSIYLDNAATTKPLPDILGTINRYIIDDWYNPSAKYRPAANIAKDIDAARHAIASKIGAKDTEIFFTSGASEANSAAIGGYLRSHAYTFPQVITTTIEHKSVLEITDDCYTFARCAVCTRLEPDLHGVIQITKEQAGNQPLQTLYSIQWANNEIGTIQDIASIANVCVDAGGVFHTDATQAFPHIPIDVSKVPVDMMSVSAHKFGGPKGIGFLYIRESCQHMIYPLIYGAQERGFRGGTENVPYIMGMAKAVELLKQTNDCPAADYLVERLAEELGCTINGGENKLRHIVSCTFPDYVVGEYLIRRLSRRGIYLSSGSACNAHSGTPSTVLEAIGLTNDEIARTVRFSLSDEITCDDIDYVIDAVKDVCRELQM